MPHFSLDEALSNPPALIAENPEKVESLQDGTGQNMALLRGNRALFRSWKNTKHSKVDAEKATVAEAIQESVLSRWSDRPSFQSFMNTISTLSAKKQQLKLQQQQHNTDRLRLFMQQGQQIIAKQQQDQRTIQQQRPNMLNPFTQQQHSPTKPNPSISNPTSISTEPTISDSPTQAKPKVRKVMKGGVLVSMPINTRHPPGQKALEQPFRGSSSLGTSHDNGVGFGNILDDILARSQGSIESNITAGKKSAIRKALDQNVKAKQTVAIKAGTTSSTYALRSSISNKDSTGGTATTYELSECNEDTTVSESPNESNVNINLNVTIAMSGEEQADITHTPMLRKSSLAQTDNVVLDNSESGIDGSLLETLPGHTSSKSGEQSVAKTRVIQESECPANGQLENSVPQKQSKSSREGTSNESSVKPIVVSDTDSDSQVNIKQTSLPTTLVNPDNSQQNALNHHSKPDTDEQDSLTPSELNTKAKASAISSSGSVYVIPPSSDGKSDNDGEMGGKLFSKTAGQIAEKGTKSKGGHVSPQDIARNGNIDKSKVDGKSDPPTDDERNGKLSESTSKLHNDTSETVHENSSNTSGQRNIDQPKTDVMPGTTTLSCREQSSGVFQPEHSVLSLVTRSRKQNAINQSQTIAEPDNATQSNIKPCKTDFKPDIDTNAKMTMKSAPVLASLDDLVIKIENETDGQGQSSINQSQSASKANNSVCENGETTPISSYAQGEINECKVATRPGLTPPNWSDLGNTDAKDKLDQFETDIKRHIVSLSPPCKSPEHDNNNQICETDIKRHFASLSAAQSAKQNNKDKTYEADIKPKSVLQSSNPFTATQVNKNQGKTGIKQVPTQLGATSGNQVDETDFNTDLHSQAKCSANSINENTNRFETGQGDMSLSCSGMQDNTTDSKDKQEPPLHSPCAGDLFIDMDSESEVTNTRSGARRAAKRCRYSSLTSETSGGEEQAVSSFDWIRKLSEEINKNVEENKGKADDTNFAATTENIDCQTGKDDIHVPLNTTTQRATNDHPPTKRKTKSSVALNHTFPNEEDVVNVKKTKRETNEKTDTEDNDRKRKEREEKSQRKTGKTKKHKQDNLDIRLNISSESYGGRITRSMYHSDLDSSHDIGNQRSFSEWMHAREPSSERETRYSSRQRRLSSEWSHAREPSSERETRHSSRQRRLSSEWPHARELSSEHDTSHNSQQSRLSSEWPHAREPSSERETRCSSRQRRQSSEWPHTSEPSSEHDYSHNSRQTRSSSEWPHARDSSSEHETSHNSQQTRSSLEEPCETSSDGNQSGRKRRLVASNYNQKRQCSRQERSQETGRLFRERPRESNNKNQKQRSQRKANPSEQQQHQARYTKRQRTSQEAGSNKMNRPVSSDGRRHSLERQHNPKVVIVKEVEETPSLLSMVTGETLDVTVAQQELSDQRKHNRKKKKKHKPTRARTEWFLRQQRQKNMQHTAPQNPAPVREHPSCLYYSRGKCAKGETCQFKHEKIKEACRYYVSNVCNNNQYGMCPKMHDDFPCVFFHKGGKCSNGDYCKYSHAALTDETWQILENYIAETAERKRAAAVASLADHASAIMPTQEKHETSTSSYLPANTNSNPGPAQEIKPANDGRYSETPNPGVGLNSALLSPPLCKPTIEAPKSVKRLCSLSSYKPRLLSSLASTVETVENKSDTKKTESPSSTNKIFQPGMFKER